MERLSRRLLFRRRMGTTLSGGTNSPVENSISNIQHGISNVQVEGRTAKYSIFNSQVENSISNIQHGISNVQAEGRTAKYPISNTEYPMSKLKAEQPINPLFEYPIDNRTAKYSISNIQQGISNVQQNRRKTEDWEQKSGARSQNNAEDKGQRTKDRDKDLNKTSLRGFVASCEKNHPEEKENWR